MSRLCTALLAVIVCAEIVAAAPVTELAVAPRAALEPAIAAVIRRFNEDEDLLRRTPRVQASGPEDEPMLLRATYRRAGPQREVIDVQPGPMPAVTVRVRASELEKRVTNINGGDLHEALAKAPWRETPRGYLIDFRLRWDGAAWQPVGEPVSHPTLGVVGGPALDSTLERGALEGGPATR